MFVPALRLGSTRNASSQLLQLRRLKMSVSKRLPGRRPLAITGALSLVLTALTPAQTQNAIANGDTRTINLYHTHSGESIQATFRVNGQYDPNVLQKLNHFLRDWRNDDTIKMDPRLFDVVWETYRESGSQEPIHIVSAYRSPQTNAMLRRRSKAVAEFSQHMLGKAMDMHYLDVPMSRVREIAMRLQRGGVGYYPTAGSPFVHLDVGNVRAWPRMSYDQLARLFPDGKTVHLPTNGQPLARYDEARAELDAGGSMPTMAQVQSKGFFERLFGGGDEEEVVAAAPRTGPRSRVAAYIENRNQAKTQAAPVATQTEELRRSPLIEQAQRNLPQGETYLSPAPMAAVPLPTARPPSAGAEPPRLMAAMDPRASDAPQPTRRPAELAPIQMAALNVPLPPMRPMELRPAEPRVAELPKPEPRPVEIRQAEIRLPDLRQADLRPEPTRIARPTELPAVITGAPTNALPPAALAYAATPETAAPAARPPAPTPRPIARAPAPRQELVAAKVDRGTLTALIRSASIMQTPSPAKAAPTQNRAEVTRVIFAQPTAVTATFGASAISLSTSAFTGRAVVGLGREAPTLDINTLASR